MQKGSVVLLSLLVAIVILCLSVQAGPSRRTRYAHHLYSYKERLHPKINIEDEGARKLYLKLNKQFSDKNGGVFPFDEPTFDCDVCLFFVEQFQVLFSDNYTIDGAEELFADICVLLGIEQRVVCSGLADEFGPEIQTIVLADPDLQPNWVCQHFLICPNEQRKPAIIESETVVVQQQQTTSPSAPKNTRFFMHFTDIHHDPLYKEGTNTKCGLPLCCRATDGPGTAHKFGEYNCDANIPLLNSLESFINTNPTFNSLYGSKVDFIIWTGDNPPHDIWAESRGSQLSASQTVADWLYSNFTLKRQWPVFPAIGNHESFPVDQFPGPPRNSWLMEPTAQFWSKWLGPSQLATVRQGAFYIKQVATSNSKGQPGPHYILSFNTMYCDLNNFWMILNDTDPAGQISWMATQLENVRKQNGTVYFIGHIPLGNSGCLYNYSSRIGDVIRKYSALGVVKGSFFGHTHDDSFFLFKQGNTWNATNPTSVAWVAPSVTPFTYLNPSFRVFEYDPETFEVVDYHQYNMDLQKTNENGIPNWRLYYSAKSAYNLTDMSPKSWENLIGVFKRDDKLFQEWNVRHYSGYYGTGACTGGCKNSTLCGFESSTAKDQFECTGQEYNLNNLWPYIVNHIV